MRIFNVCVVLLPSGNPFIVFHAQVRLLLQPPRSEPPGGFLNRAGDINAKFFLQKTVFNKGIKSCILKARVFALPTEIARRGVPFPLTT